MTPSKHCCFVCGEEVDMDYVESMDGFAALIHNDRGGFLTASEKLATEGKICSWACLTELMEAGGPKNGGT